MALAPDSPADVAACPICLCEPETTELSTVNGCTHTLCFTCISNWANSENTCPLCKNRFSAITLVHTREGIAQSTTVQARNQRTMFMDQPAPFSSFSFGAPVARVAGDAVITIHIGDAWASSTGSFFGPPVAAGRAANMHGSRVGSRERLDTAHAPLTSFSFGSSFGATAMGELSSTGSFFGPPVAAGRAANMHDSRVGSRERLDTSHAPLTSFSLGSSFGATAMGDTSTIMHGATAMPLLPGGISSRFSPDDFSTGNNATNFHPATTRAPSYDFTSGTSSDAPFTENTATILHQASVRAPSAGIPFSANTTGGTATNMRGATAPAPSARFAFGSFVASVPLDTATSMHRVAVCAPSTETSFRPFGAPAVRETRLPVCIQLLRGHPILKIPFDHLVHLSREIRLSVCPV
jgi:hypothetical protein